MEVRQSAGQRGFRRSTSGFDHAPLSRVFMHSLQPVRIVSVEIPENVAPSTPRYFWQIALHNAADMGWRRSCRAGKVREEKGLCHAWPDLSLRFTSGLCVDDRRAGYIDLRPIAIAIWVADDCMWGLFVELGCFGGFIWSFGWNDLAFSRDRHWSSMFSSPYKVHF